MRAPSPRPQALLLRVCGQCGAVHFVDRCPCTLRLREETPSLTRGAQALLGLLSLTLGCGLVGLVLWCMAQPWWWLGGR